MGKPNQPAIARECKGSNRYKCPNCEQEFTWAKRSKKTNYPEGALELSQCIEDKDAISRLTASNDYRDGLLFLSYRLRPARLGHNGVKAVYDPVKVKALISDILLKYS